MKTLKRILLTVVLILTLLPISLYADTVECNVMITWDPSIDAPYLQSYRVYYYRTSNTPESLTPAEYAKSYNLANDSMTYSIDPTGPKSIDIPSTNLQIKLNGLAAGTWYFALTAIDTRGLESIPTPEISTILSPPTRPQAPRNSRLIETEYKYTYDNGTVHIVILPAK